MKTPARAFPTLVSSSATPALCLGLVPRTGILSAEPFLVGPAHPRNRSRRHPPTPSAATAPFPILASRDQSP